jgi:hypothetical protein
LEPPLKILARSLNLKTDLTLLQDPYSFHQKGLKF